LLSARLNYRLWAVGQPRFGGGDGPTPYLQYFIFIFLILFLNSNIE
jgi:hypothetical protein